MSKQQLESLRKKVGLRQFRENGQLLHVRELLGGSNEWTVLTYNLQILGQYIRDNIDLRKKIVELMDTYIKLIAAPGTAKPGIPTQPANPSDPNYMFMMLSHRLDENDKRFDRLEEMLKNKLGGGW